MMIWHGWPGLTTLGLLFNIICFMGSTVRAADGIVALTSEEIEDRKQQKNQQKPTYIDQLIDESFSEDGPIPLSEEGAYKQDSQANFHAFEISSYFRHKQHTQQQNTQSSGLSMEAYYQTLGYGDLSASIIADYDGLEQQDGTDTDNENNSQPSKQGGHFTLRQRNFAYNEHWTIDNTLGVVHANLNPLFLRSRQTLPGQVMQGGSLRGHSQATEWRFWAGQKGTITDSHNFETDGSDLVGMGFAQHINRQWSFASQIWHNRDDNNPISNQTELALTFNYLSEDNQRDFNLQVLNNRKATGIWMNGKFEHGRFSHTGDFYRVEDNLSWMGNAFLSQGQGGSWRTTLSHPVYHANTAINWQQSTSLESYQITQGGRYRYSRRTQLGGSITYRHSRSDTGKASHLQLTTSAFHRFDNGQQGSLRLSAQQQESEQNKELTETRSYGVNYAQQLLNFDMQKLDLQLRFQHQTDEYAHPQNTWQLGLAWQKAWENGFSLHANVNGAYLEGGEKAGAHMKYQLKARYELDEHWVMEGSWDHGTNKNDVFDQSGLYLSVNYNYSNGKAVSLADQRSGHIQGMVFFDENNDGIKQPLEKVATGIVVNLNTIGRSIKTDHTGIFEFKTIKTGEYTVTIDESTLPLPWELVSNPDLKFAIKPRQTQILNIPLVKLNGDVL